MKASFFTKLTFFILFILLNSATAAEKLYIAGGLDSGAQANLLTLSNDGGKTWQIKPLPGVNNSASMGAADCTGPAGAASCLVSIKNHVTSAQQLFPLLYYSRDNGNKWSPVSLLLPWAKDVAYDIAINKVSCTGSASDVICFAAGSAVTLRSARDLLPSPLLIATSNGGKDWSLKLIPGLPAKGEFSGASCTGSGDQAVCVVIGNSTTNKPLIAVSNDGGKTLSLRNIVENADPIHLSALSCTGNGANAVCAIIGKKMDATDAALIIDTADGGDTWHVKPLEEYSVKLKSVSCTGVAPATVCAVGGIADKEPLLLASTDNGNTWQKKSINVLENSGAVQSVSCAGNGGSAVCMAMGIMGGFSNYFMSVSRDGAATWQLQTLSDDLRYTESSGVSCDGLGPVSCMLWGAGISKTYWQTPIIATTSDNGIHWQSHDLPGVVSGVINEGLVAKTVI
jgi:photosystem II stability/assembly factor-like uncharacterized protein